MGESRAAQLRRTGRPDRGDASRTGGATQVDQRRPLPAHAELLHVAAGTGGGAAGHLYWPAAAADGRRIDCRRAVRTARLCDHPGVEHRLCALWPCAPAGGSVLRAEGRRAGCGDQGCASHRSQGLEKSDHGGHRCTGFRGNLFPQGALSADRPGRWFAGLRGAVVLAEQFPGTDIGGDRCFLRVSGRPPAGPGPASAHETVGAPLRSHRADLAGHLVIAGADRDRRIRRAQRAGATRHLLYADGDGHLMPSSPMLPSERWKAFTGSRRDKCWTDWCSPRRLPAR
jgi:hypothetical protein